MKDIYCTQGQFEEFKEAIKTDNYYDGYIVFADIKTGDKLTKFINLHFGKTLPLLGKILFDLNQRDAFSEFVWGSVASQEVRSQLAGLKKHPFDLIKLTIVAGSNNTTNEKRFYTTFDLGDAKDLVSLKEFLTVQEQTA